MRYLELRVVQGLHRGAAIAVAAQRITVGSSPDCDIVLLDTGVLPEHLRIEVRSGQAYLHPSEEPLALEKPIAAGEARLMLCMSDLPWVVESNSADTRGAAPHHAAKSTVNSPKPNRTAGRLRRGGVVLICLLGLMLLGSVWIFMPRSSEANRLSKKVVRSSIAPVPKVVNTPAMPVPVATPKQVTLTTAELKIEAGAALRAREIAAYAKINEVEGRLRIDAELDEQETIRLENALKVLKERFGNDVAIEAKVVPLNESLPFKVREVLLGPTSHITLNDGQRLYEGMMYKGVRLEAVRPHTLVFMSKRRIEMPW